VFNEPENMLDSTATAPRKITQNDILRITNKIAGFIHRNSKKNGFDRDHVISI
jgi:aspartyl/asparaginyl-tRNA synthetase